jgi:hypothetical protein
MECLLGAASEATTAGAIELLEQRLNFHPNEEEPLEPLVWRALERNSVPLKDSTVKYRWNKLARRYLPKDPVRMARIVLAFFARESSFLLEEDPIVQTLAEATRLAPEAVWAEVAARLKDNDRSSWQLHFCLQGWYAQVVGEEPLLAWAEQNQPEGPRIVAELTPVDGASFNSLARNLLIRFGDDRAVASALRETFGTGTFGGSESDWLQAHLDTARQWLKDPHPAVREWAKQEVESLEKQLDHARLYEAEEVFGGV